MAWIDSFETPQPTLKRKRSDDVLDGWQVSVIDNIYGTTLRTVEVGGMGYALTKILPSKADWDVCKAIVADFPEIVKLGVEALAQKRAAEADAMRVAAAEEG